MRALPVLLLCCAAAVQAADGPDTLGGARRLATTGTSQLALNLVEKSQPHDPGAPQWAEWEALRCNLLTRLDRSRELMERADRLPSGVAAPALRECLLPALRAAAKAGEGARARRYAARMLWQGDANADEIREIRLIVIDSHVADRRGDDVYRSMLRYDLDYRPVDRRIAARFVAGLLELNLAREAVNWLANLDDAQPIKLMLRLQAGLVEPAAAVKLARGFAHRNPDAGWWEIIARAARMEGMKAVEIEALELRLQLAPPSETRRAAIARELWQTYFATAGEAAEQHHLLKNDDAGWVAFAEGRARSEPTVARAFLAHVGRRASALEARQEAQRRLYRSLQSAKLDLVALHLFADDAIPVSSLDPQLRFSLGAAAEARGDHAVALRMWQGLPPPLGSTIAQWQLRLASAMVRAAEIEPGAALTKQALGAAEPLNPELLKQASALANDMLDMGHPGAAEEVLAVLAQRVDDGDRRRVLFSLGRASDANGKPLAAAEHYLRCATLAGPKTPDALAREARLAAGLSLARGGYRDDARTQFEWVLKNSRDPAQLDVARRELKRL
jgi:hypothetical protein